MRSRFSPTVRSAVFLPWGAEGSEKIKETDEIEIDADKGIIKNLSTQEEYKANPIPPFMQELIDAGGLIEWTKQRLIKIES